MATTVTDTIRKNLVDLFLNQVTTSSDSNQFYIGIGKSDVYDATDTTVSPQRRDREEQDHRNNLQSIKKVEASSFVIPRKNWSSGREYSAYSDSFVGIPTNEYYVLTDINEVFICLKAAKNASGVVQNSTVKPEVPAGRDRNKPFQLSDGYVWKFLYGLSAGRANSFLSANFVPVELVTKDSSASNAFELQQLLVQNTTIGGQILGIEMESNGAGYSSTPTVTIRGNGSAGAATATLSGGAVVKVEMNNESAGFGSGYDYASVLFSGGSPSKPAKARAVIGPRDGIGFDPRDDLKASSIMLNIKPDGTVTNTFIVGNDFRQISLLKSPKFSDSSVAGGFFKGTSSRVMRSMKANTTTAAATLTIGREITDGSTPKIKAYIDDISDSSIFYHQNDSSGFGVFANSASISDGINGITIDSGDIKPPVDPYSGELLYVENRARILRDAAQQEDIKVIVTV